MIVIVFK